KPEGKDNLKATAKMAAQDKVMSQLKDLMYNSTIDGAETKLAELSDLWAQQQPAFLAYFKKQWLKDDKHKRWMKAYRFGQYYGTMDTNNYVESWHNTLKHSFLKGKYNIRLDHLVYIIRRSIVPYFQYQTSMKQLGFGRMSEQERRQRSIEKEVDEMQMNGTLHVLISRSDVGFIIKSFTKDNIEYEVVVVRREVQGCSCPYYLSQRAMCKHIYGVIINSHRLLHVPHSGQFINAPSRQVHAINIPSSEVEDAKESVLMKRRKAQSTMEAVWKEQTAIYHAMQDVIERAASLEDAADMEDQVAIWVAGFNTMTREISNNAGKKRHLQEQF
ncbi:hypothetical protein BGX28_001508, partial [Mortierella sp. GBA30]